ncbi:MAG: hypothetical protein AAF206_31395 [Bacteroidota bacterium]
MKSSNRYRFLALAFSILALLASPIVFWGENPLVLFGLAGASVVMVILSGKIRYLAYLLINPVVFLPLYFSVQAISNVWMGQPKLIRCTSYEPGESKIDSKTGIQVTYWDDDCDWGALYPVSIDVNNRWTRGLMID